MPDGSVSMYEPAQLGAGSMSVTSVTRKRLVFVNSYDQTPKPTIRVCEELMVTLVTPYLLNHLELVTETGHYWSHWSQLGVVA